MMIKLLGFLCFIILVIYKKYYYSMGWLDLPSLFIVLGGSCVVWLIFHLLKKQINFIAKNISIFIGLAYCFIWGIQILVSERTDIILISLVPVGYGLAISILFEYFYNRMEKKCRIH